MKLIVLLTIVVLGLVLFVRYLESKSIFYPSREMNETPLDAGIAYEEVYIPVTRDKIRIYGWWMHKSEDVNTVLFLHGNAGNISDRLVKLALFDQIGVNVLIVDYRGYGKSEGSPSEQGMYRDAQAGYDYLVNERKINPGNIIVYGVSLGGAAAVDVAEKNRIGGLIINSSFSNARDMARHIFPIIPSIFVQAKLDSDSKIAEIKVPKLFFHSRDDRTVPYKLGRKLYDAAPEPKRFVDIIGGHNDGHIHSHNVFNDELRQFIFSIKDGQ